MNNKLKKKTGTGIIPRFTNRYIRGTMLYVGITKIILHGIRLTNPVTILPII